jgi:hypothetical protein
VFGVIGSIGSEISETNAGGKEDLSDSGLPDSVYWTMGLPIVTTLIIVGRSCSLENASEGVRLLCIGSEISETNAGGKEDLSDSGLPDSSRG